MAPLAALKPPTHPRQPDEDTRAIGNDGLTDVEREENSWRYVTTGAGRRMGDQERADMRAWLAGRRGNLSG